MPIFTTPSSFAAISSPRCRRRCRRRYSPLRFHSMFSISAFSRLIRHYAITPPIFAARHFAYAAIIFAAIATSFPCQISPAATPSAAASIAITLSCISRHFPVCALPPAPPLFRCLPGRFAVIDAAAAIFAISLFSFAASARCFRFAMIFRHFDVSSRPMMPMRAADCHFAAFARLR